MCVTLCIGVHERRQAYDHGFNAHPFHTDPLLPGGVAFDDRNAGCRTRQPSGQLGAQGTVGLAGLRTRLQSNHEAASPWIHANK